MVYHEISLLNIYYYFQFYKLINLSLIIFI